VAGAYQRIQVLADRVAFEAEQLVIYPAGEGTIAASEPAFQVTGL
jgi:hypothetical protein